MGGGARRRGFSGGGGGGSGSGQRGPAGEERILQRVLPFEAPRSRGGANWIGVGVSRWASYTSAPTGRFTAGTAL